jgi:hypothetical protein
LIRLKNLFQGNELLLKSNLNKKLLLLVVLTVTSVSFSQVIYEPLYKDVYNYLRRLSQKGIIEFNDLIRPLPKKYLLEKLIEAEKKSDQLTSLEKEELEFFKKDYYHELWFVNGEVGDNKHMIFINDDPVDRWRMFSYDDSHFKMNANLILGLEYGSLDKEKRTHFWNGIYTDGYIEDVLGFSFDFRDNTESGNTIDKNKNFTPVTGVNERSDETIFDYPSDKIEYSETKGMLTTDWKWGSLAAGKDFMEWGYSENGLIVLSQKAPSFPFIRLDVYPVDWLRFNYFHGWLASDVLDSSDVYHTEEGEQRFLFRDKFIASHTLTFYPANGLDFSIGESIIYSDELEFVYLIPVMFFRLADHYLSRQVNAYGGNAQFFANISSRNHIKNTHLYGTLFIDEFTLSGAFDTEDQRNQVGFTLGSSVVDLPIDNLTFKLEYTKIFPFVYQHYLSTTTYQSASYVMGHWMNNNTDQVYASIKYRFLRGLDATIWGRYLRQGQKDTVGDIYVQPQPPFLYGLRTNYTYFGATVKYEFLHDLFARVRYQYTKTSQQQEDLNFIDSSIQEFHFAVYYGL